MTEPKRRGSLVDEIMEQLLEVITSGEFEPGQRISESSLSRQLGVSRGPLREALGRLEGRLVERRLNQGVRMRVMTREEIEGLFYAREALEGMAARLAAQSITNQEISAIYEMLDAHTMNINGAAQGRYLQGLGDEDFHFAIMRAASCAPIQQILMNEIYFQLRIQRRKSGTQPGRAMAALAEHRQVVDALSARNPDLAEAAMRLHLRNARISTMAALRDKPNCLQLPHLATA
jgi:DNA-binding GntR family transcriptional regulator